MFCGRTQPEDAKSIRRVKTAIETTNIKNELSFIKTNFACIPTAIKKLETAKLPIVAAIEIFESVRIKLETIHSRPEFKSKLERVIEKNKGFAVLKQIGNILVGQQVLDQQDQLLDFSSCEISAFEYAPTTSCDVERSFSKYKRILDGCRCSFLFENLRKHVVIYCNYDICS